MEKKREIFIRIDGTPQIAQILLNIRKKEKEIQKLFEMYDNLNIQENKIFDNWSSYLEETIQKLDYVTL